MLAYAFAEAFSALYFQCAFIEILSRSYIKKYTSERFHNKNIRLPRTQRNREREREGEKERESNGERERERVSERE